MLVLFLWTLALLHPAHALDDPGRNAGALRHVVILHTNDLHGSIEPWTGWEGELLGRRMGGMAWLAGAVSRVRAEEGPQKVLLLDAGDALGDSMLADLTRGEAVLELMRALRYDAVAVGNHEVDFGALRLFEPAAPQAPRILAANLRRKADGAHPAAPAALIERAGVRIGVIGLAYPNTPLTTAAKNVRELSFDADPARAVRSALPRLREEGAELVIVLSHLGLGAEKKLAEDAPGIDVIVGGHSHNRVPQALRIGNTLLVQAGAHGSDLGRLDLWLDGAKVVRHRRELIALDHARVGADAQVAQRVATLRAPHASELDAPLGVAAEPIVRAQTLAGASPGKRDAESPADSLFADILRSETRSDIALLPGVGYGLAIPAGPVRAGQLRGLVPHDSRVVTLTLTGAQVRAILEQSLENVYTQDPARKVGGMIQVSGLRFVYDAGRPAGERIVRLERDGGTWNEKARYRVATNTLLAEGGHGYQAFLAGRERADHGGQYDMIAGWVRRNTPVRTPPPGRILRAADPR